MADVVVMREWLRDGSVVDHYGPPPAPPPVVQAWALKAVLEQDGVLATVEAAMDAAAPEWKWAFRGRPEWSREAALGVLAAVGFTEPQIADWLRRAAALEGNG